MRRVETAQVVHCLADNVRNDYPSHKDWLTIAQCLVDEGFDWPAAVALAAMTTKPPDVVATAVLRLAEQTRWAMGELQPLYLWDTACGLVGRSWRLGLRDAIDAIHVLNLLCTELQVHDSVAEQVGLRPRVDRRRPGFRIIHNGMTLTDLQAFQDVDDDAVALLEEADRLLPPDAVNSRLCEAMVVGLT